MRISAALAILFLGGCVATPSLTEVDPTGTIVAGVRVLPPPARYAAAGLAMEAAGLISYREIEHFQAERICRGSGACSRILLGGSCVVTISIHYEPAIRAALIDHERAHCGGWPPDHPL